MYWIAALTSYQRNFKFITMLGFASTVMASWEVLLPYVPEFICPTGCSPND